jgi:hypothetical protein
MYGPQIKRHVHGSLSYGGGEGLVRSSSRESLSGVSVASAPASTTAGSQPALTAPGVAAAAGLPHGPHPHVPVPHAHPHAHAAQPGTSHTTHGSGIADV